MATELARISPDAAFLGREHVDLADPETCARTIAGRRPDAVINAAAWTAVDAAEAEPEAAQLVNAKAPAAMARTCAEAGILLVQISTDYVLGGGGRLWRPDDPVRPLGAYGRTNLAGEAAVRGADGPHAVLRTSWVFSAHGANFVRTMLRLGAERSRLRVVADQIGGPTPAAAIAAACLRIARTLRDDPALTGTYHLTGAPDVSWAGFARAIFATAGLDVDVEDIPTRDYPTPAPRQLNSRLDCTATEAAFDLDRPDWRETLPTVIAELGRAELRSGGRATGRRS